MSNTAKSKQNKSDNIDTLRSKVYWFFAKLGQLIKRGDGPQQMKGS